MIVTSSLYLGWPVEIRDKSGDGLAVHPCDADFWILNIVLQLKQKFSWTDTSYSPDYNTNLTAPFGTAPCSEVIQRRNKKLGEMYCMIACVESHGVWGRQIELKRWNVTNLHCRKSVDYISWKMMQPPSIIFRVRLVAYLHTYTIVSRQQQQQIKYSNIQEEAQRLVYASA